MAEKIINDYFKTATKETYYDHLDKIPYHWNVKYIFPKIYLNKYFPGLLELELEECIDRYHKYGYIEYFPLHIFNQYKVYYIYYKIKYGNDRLSVQLFCDRLYEMECGVSYCQLYRKYFQTSDIEELYLVNYKKIRGWKFDSLDNYPIADYSLDKWLEICTSVKFDHLTDDEKDNFTDLFWGGEINRRGMDLYGYDKIIFNLDDFVKRVKEIHEELGVNNGFNLYYDNSRWALRDLDDVPKCVVFYLHHYGPEIPDYDTIDVDIVNYYQNYIPLTYYEGECPKDIDELISRVDSDYESIYRYFYSDKYLFDTQFDIFEKNNHPAWADDFYDENKDLMSNLAFTLCWGNLCLYR